MPSLIVERGGRFGARIPKRRGGYSWLGTFDERAQAEQAVMAARRPRARREPARGWVVPPTGQQVLDAAAAAPAPFGAFILTAAFSGLRLFEVAGIHVEDIDFPGERVMVRRGKGGYSGETSLIFEPALGALAAHLGVDTPFTCPACGGRAVRGRCGCGWRMPDTGRVFSTAVGTAFDRRHVARLWRPVAQVTGIGCTFHGLRHFHACWLLDQGASVEDVAVQLRHHDNGELVRRVYGRYRSSRAALSRLDGLR